ncbi:PDZ domain-containing protein [Qipengyuania sp.]|uniref:PDZ domain-containing protein n=1 Tax=Qipengyuania sp. TaxID=2004515 RepID=UPI0035C7ACB0
MKRLIIAAALASAVPASPAFADVPYAVTPSGRTEAIFDMGVTDASDRIANGCADMGWTLINSTSTMVQCEAKLSTMQGLLSALLIGNQYSTPPKNYIRFNIAGLNGSSRVQATGWIETQMAFGQTRTEEMDGAHYHNNVMELFSALGGRFPGGTTFPNHAYLGASFQETNGNGLIVTEVEPQSPAGLGGIVAGDRIVRISKEKIKTSANLLDGLRKAVKNPSYDVEIMRGDSKQTMTLARDYRMVVVEPDPSTLPQLAVEEPMPTQQVLPLSAADELAKFAKLRDDGIISESEFETQKVRLLTGG